MTKPKKHKIVIDTSGSMPEEDLTRAVDEAQRLIEAGIEFSPGFCSVCNGELQVLGMLGSTLHYRCRHCGNEESAKS